MGDFEKVYVCLLCILVGPLLLWKLVSDFFGLDKPNNKKPTQQNVT